MPLSLTLFLSVIAHELLAFINTFNICLAELKEESGIPTEVPEYTESYQ